MNYSYPILNKIFNYYNTQKHDVKDVYLIGCQHLLEPQLKMIEKLIQFGFSSDKIIMLGKSYSTNKDILNELQELGINAIQPKFLGISFDEEHKNNCENLLKLIPQNAKIILMDDGAQLIKTFNDSNKEVFFAVEQTSSGFRKLENEIIRFPIFNVARSKTKLIQESPLIAHHLYERIITYLKERELKTLKVLVVGLGPIGEALNEVFDENKIKIDGFDVKLGHFDLIEKIKKYRPNIIIGATGNQILNNKDIESLSSNDIMYLISASSSDREFPVAQFRTRKEDIHDDIKFKNIIFVNNGFPFTFMGNRCEILPIEIEKTICLLSGSVMYGAIKKVTGIGLLNIPEELENLVN